MITQFANVTDRRLSDSQVFLEVLLKGTLFPGYVGQSVEETLRRKANGDSTSNNTSHPGEVLSPIEGEMRLESDFALSQGISSLELPRIVNSIRPIRSPHGMLMASDDQYVSSYRQ
jgi:hypothetical protein